MRLAYSNKVRMYKAVGVYLEKYPSQVNSIPEFFVTLGNFKTKVERITTLDVVKEGITSGKTEAKYLAEQQLIKSAVNTASSLFTYARKNNLTELISIAGISARKLDRMKEVDLIIKCKQLYTEAKKISATVLKNFGLSSEEIEDLNAKADAFEKAIGERGSAGAEKAGTDINISDLFKEVDDRLDNDLDVYARKFIDKDKAFYDGYTAAREIKDLGVHHKNNEDDKTNPDDSDKKDDTSAPANSSTTPST
jgi:hypothetical protein